MRKRRRLRRWYQLKQFFNADVVVKFRAVALSEISQTFGEIVPAGGYSEIEPVVDGLSGFF